MSSYPFSPEKLARLAALSREINARSGPAPFAEPVLVDDRGSVLVPVPEGGHAWTHIHAGLHVGWTGVPEQDGLLLVQIGNRDDGEIADGITAFLTRDGFRRLIVDLQSIEAQL